jgi:hypothetical protein
VFALFAVAGVGALGAGPSATCSGLQFLNMLSQELTTTITIDPDPMVAGQESTATATVAGPRWVTQYYYTWTVNGAEVYRGTSNSIGLTIDQPGQHLIEVEVTDVDGSDDVYDARSMYVEVQPAPGGTTSVGGSTGAATSATVTIQGPNELMVGGSGSYSASSSVAGASITWDLLGGGATLGSSSGSSTSVTATAAGFVSLVAEARDSSTGAVLGTATYSIGISAAPGYKVYITSQICTNGQLEVRRVDEVAAGITLCSLEGGGNDCSVMAVLSPVTGEFATAEEAVAAMCGQVTEVFYHRFAGWLGTYNGQQTCMSERFHSLLSSQCGQ